MDDHSAGRGARIGGSALHLDGRKDGGHHAAFRGYRVGNGDSLYAGSLAQTIFDGFKELELLGPVRVAFSMKVDFGDQGMFGTYPERSLELVDEGLDEGGGRREEDKS